MDNEDRERFQPLSKRREEEEYFLQSDVELVRKMRRKLDQEREAKRLSQEQELHWQRCPKCGGQMIEREENKVKIDICERCGGLFLDKGELEIILKMKDTFLDRLSRRVDSFFTRGFDIKRTD
ncbi:MAG: zf-TFIIB domain-containing protein [Acidobacteria bacterium]|nr:zf-TFIIB domain-containing protein [Acidobacteriota bacterium]